MISALARRIADFLLGGPVRPARKKPLPEILFLPVIFANGRDDDSEGLKAFWENRPYIFRGTVYRPSSKPRQISGEKLAISHHGIVFVADGKIVTSIGGGSRMLFCDIGHRLERTVSHCRMTLGLKVQP